MKIEQIMGKNQFIIAHSNTETFQSYNSIIAIRTIKYGKETIVLDSYKWNYSKTTSKYRNIFLGETTKETEKKIENGEYILKDLNKGA